MIFNCDARHIPLPDKSINCVITSPPYYALRKYDIPDVTWDDGWVGQLGMEPHYDDFVKHLCDIFDETKRVLRDDGIIFININDSYGGSGGDSGKKPGRERKGGSRGIDTRPVGIGQEVVLNEKGYIAVPPESQKFTPKSLLGIPERFMLEMLNRGWILRNKIIWWKPNCLPHSVKDRFTVDWEPIYFFSKKKDYFFDQQFEPYGGDWGLRDRSEGKYQKEGLHSPTGLTGKQRLAVWGVNKDGSYYGIGKKEYEEEGVQNPSDVKRSIIESWTPLGRNMRCVWRIPTAGLRDSHFAIFPDDLVKPMILAGVPEEQCKKCGKPREKVYDSEYFGDYDTKVNKPRPDPRDPRVFREKDMNLYKKQLVTLTDCGCNAGWEPGAVLDPFAGSGTTIRVATKLDRRGYGCDLGYKDISSKRTTNVQKIWG